MAHNHPVTTKCAGLLGCAFAPLSIRFNPTCVPTSALCVFGAQAILHLHTRDCGLCNLCREPESQLLAEILGALPGLDEGQRGLGKPS